MKAKKFFTVAATAALLVGVTGQAVAAGEWVLAADSADSNLRYLVDTSQLEKRTNKHGVALLSIPIRAVGETNSGTGYVVIEASSCGGSGGEMAVVFDTKDVNNYWWSRDGGRMYDRIGASICQIASADTSEQMALVVENFAKSKPPAVFERVRSTMADAIDANNSLTLEEAYVIAVNYHFEVTVRNYKSLGLTDSDFERLSAANRPTPRSLLGA